MIRILASAAARAGSAVAASFRTRPFVCAGLLATMLVLAPASAHALAFIPVMVGGALIAGGLMVANDVACWWFMDCGTGTATVAMQKNCFFCGIFVTLACQGGGYSRAIFLMFAPMALSLSRFLFLMFLAMQIGKLFVWPKDGGENLKEIVKQAGIYTLAIATMTASIAGGDNPWLFEWLFDLMQRLTLAVSMKAINYMAMQGIGQVIEATVPNFSGGCQGFLSGSTTGAVAAALPFATPVAQQYANLWAHVELGVYPVIAIAMNRLTPDHFTAAGAIAGIMLAAPYVFVMGVFGALLVQSMFYFIAITAAAPFLIAGIMFQTTRGWLVSALRFLVGGCMTIFFCAIAMGFTLSLIVINMAIQMKDVGAADIGVVQGLKKSPFGEAAGGLMAAWQFLSGGGSSAGSSTATTATNVITLTLSSVDNSAYWMLFLTGYISIMLHLAAPRIASNLSGSNDSATTAAAVVGVGQLAASKVAGAGRFGAVGAIGAAGDGAGRAGGYAWGRAADLLSAFRGAGKP